MPRDVKVGSPSTTRSSLSDSAKEFQAFVDSGLYAHFGGGGGMSVAEPLPRPLSEQPDSENQVPCPEAAQFLKYF